MTIDHLTTGFGLVTLAIVVAALYLARRRPAAWLAARAARRVAVDRVILAGLLETLDHARARGDATLFARLARSYDNRRAALLALDPTTRATDVPPAPSFETAVERRAAA